MDWELCESEEIIQGVSFEVFFKNVNNTKLDRIHIGSHSIKGINELIVAFLTTSETSTFSVAFETKKGDVIKADTFIKEEYLFENNAIHCIIWVG